MLHSWVFLFVFTIGHYAQFVLFLIKSLYSYRLQICEDVWAERFLHVPLEHVGSQIAAMIDSILFNLALCIA